MVKWMNSSPNPEPKKSVSGLPGPVEPEGLTDYKRAHKNSDVDADKTSIHHTLGPGPGQAAPGSIMRDLYVVGEVIMRAGTGEPPGFFFCDGRAVSRTEYKELYDAIGTLYGTGDGSTTFNIPDMRWRAPVGRNVDTPVNYNEGLPVGSRSGALIPVRIHGHGGDVLNEIASGTISSEGSHTHTGSTNLSGTHSHGGDVGSAVLNLVSTTPNTGSFDRITGPAIHDHSLTINSDGSHSHSFIASSDGYHSHTFNGSSHDHELSIPANVTDPDMTPIPMQVLSFFIRYHSTPLSETNYG